MITMAHPTIRPFTSHTYTPTTITIRFSNTLLPRPKHTLHSTYTVEWAISVPDYDIRTFSLAFYYYNYHY